MSQQDLNARKYPRVALELPAWVSGARGTGIALMVRNMSAGGALLEGDRFIKSVLYKPKSKYTHRPVRIQMEIELEEADTRLRTDGVGVHLRWLTGDRFQVGVKFLQSAPDRRLVDYLAAYDSGYSSWAFDDLATAGNRAAIGLITGTVSYS